MPIIVNAEGGGSKYPTGQQAMDSQDIGKLRDMISQAVSDQFQLHQARQQHGLDKSADKEYVPEPDDQLNEELAALNTE